jgi:hypothetical protein
LGQLESLKLGFEPLGNVKLEGQEELRKEFEKNSSILEQLVLSTHKWIPLEEYSITIDLHGIRLKGVQWNQERLKRVSLCQRANVRSVRNRPLVHFSFV